VDPQAGHGTGTGTPHSEQNPLPVRSTDPHATHTPMARNGIQPPVPTDSEYVSSDIMRDIYSHAHGHEIPELRSLVLAHRAKAKEEATGVLSLFDAPPPSVAATAYQHTEPWEPPHSLATTRGT